MILDISFILDVVGGDENALRRLDLLEREHRPEKVSAITVLELYEGVILSEKPVDERRAVLEVLDSKHIHDADHDIMQRAGELSGEHVAARRQIDREDCIIAAKALREDDPVLTRNVSHFERIEGLSIEEY